MRTPTIAPVKVADEVWIATALLHRENLSQPDFSIEEIIARATQESLAGRLRPGVYAHVVQHCVANRPPNPGRYRMLFETSPGRRRLFRKGDPYHAQREGSKITPALDQIPDDYRELLSWYDRWALAGLKSSLESDPLLRLVGSGKELWADEHADEYVNRLREDPE